MKHAMYVATTQPSCEAEPSRQMQFDTGDVMMGNITFYDFCCFSICESAHVAVNVCLNYSFYSASAP